MEKHKIAVYSKNGELVPFVQCDTRTMYEKEAQGWKKISEEKYSPIESMTIKALREEMKPIVKLSEGAEAVACRGITGIPFSMFDMEGYCIFSITDTSGNTFDGMMEDIDASDEKKRMHDEIIKNASPVESETKGIYFLDLIMLQKECPEVSSKKALRKFLEDVPFLELDILCAHIPPWLEHDGRYELTKKAENGAIKVKLTKKQC